MHSAASLPPQQGREQAVKQHYTQRVWAGFARSIGNDGVMFHLFSKPQVRADASQRLTGDLLNRWNITRKYAVLLAKAPEGKTARYQAGLCCWSDLQVLLNAFVLP